MTTQLELQAAKVTVGSSGQIGTKAILPLDVDKIVTSANMKVGAYTIAAQPTVPCRVTITHTAVGTVDTLGTINIVGTLPSGTTVHEKVTPVANSTVSTVNEFATVTSATGAGWVIDGVEATEDTITIGMGSVIVESFYFNAIDDRIVASANMKVGAYTVANQPLTPCKLTVTATAVDTADTMGTVTIKGVSNDVPITEVVTPVAGSTVTTTNEFSHVYSVVGAGWVIDDEEGSNDTIIVGTAEVNTASKYYISAIQILAAAVVASQTAQSGYTVADLTKFNSIPVGIYPTRLTAVEFTSGEGIAYLQTI